MSGPNERRVPKIKREMLQNESKREEHGDSARLLLNEGDRDESVNEWKKVKLW